MLILIFALVNIEFLLRNSLQIPEKLTEQGQQTFSLKGQRANILGLASHTVSTYYNYSALLL